MSCISLATSSSCVWCAESQGGRAATLNVCNPHGEIVSRRSGPVNSFLAGSPVLIPPPKGELSHPNIYFLDSFSLHAYTVHTNPEFSTKHTHPASLPHRHTSLSKPSLYLHAIFTQDAHTHTKTYFLTHFFCCRKYLFTQTHCFTLKRPVWDSTGDSYNSFGTSCGTGRRQRETAADAVVTASGLP